MVMWRTRSEWLHRSVWQLARWLWGCRLARSSVARPYWVTVRRHCASWRLSECFV